jgi:uncharacterized OB-fold protein
MVKPATNPTGVKYLRTDAHHLVIVDRSAKHDGHLIRRCTGCGRTYVAAHYHSLHCQVRGW